MLNYSSVSWTKEKTIYLKENNRAPFNGYLLTEGDFNKTALAVLELSICESRLKQKQCGSSLEDEYEDIKQNAMFFVLGLVVGGVALTALK